MKPLIKIIANNKDISSVINNYLIDFSYTDEAGSSSDKISFSLDDREDVLSFPKKGAYLAVSFGYEEQGIINQGAFYVDEVKFSFPPRKIDVTARAAELGKEFKESKNKSFDGPNQTLGDIVAHIASLHGLKPRISPQLAKEVIPHIDQTNESDISFLSRLADDRDAIVKPKEGYLLFLIEANAKTASGTQLPKKQLDISDITSGSCTMNDRLKYNSVAAFYYDKAKAERVSVYYGDGATPAFFIRSNCSSRDDAYQRARAKFNKLNRLTGSLSLAMPGDPEFAAETPVALSGFKPGINGDWIVKKVTHKINSGGYSMDMELQPDK